MYYRFQTNGTIHSTSCSPNATRLRIPTRTSYFVSFFPPSAVTPLDAREFAKIEVLAWNGQADTEPMWGGRKCNIIARKAFGVTTVVVDKKAVVWMPLGALYRQCVAMETSFRAAPWFLAIGGTAEYALLERLGV